MDELTQLADNLAGDYTSVQVAKASAPITPVSTVGVNTPAVVSPSAFNWKSPWVIGGGVLTLGVVALAALRPRKRG